MLVVHSYACLLACAMSLPVCSRLSSRWQCKLPSNVSGYAVGLLVCKKVDKLSGRTSFHAQQSRCTKMVYQWRNISWCICQSLVLACAHGLLVYSRFDKLLIGIANVRLAVPTKQNSTLVNWQYHLCFLMILTCSCHDSDLLVCKSLCRLLTIKFPCYTYQICLWVCVHICACLCYWLASQGWQAIGSAPSILSNVWLTKHQAWCAFTFVLTCVLSLSWDMVNKLP